MRQRVVAAADDHGVAALCRSAGMPYVINDAFKTFGAVDVVFGARMRDGEHLLG